MRTLVIVLVLGTMNSAFADRVGAAWRCDITTKFSCEPSGCKPNQLGVWNIVDLDNKTFSRCGQSGCDRYEMVWSAVGAFVSIALPERGVLAKMASDGSQYVEVVTLGISTLVSFGTCNRS